MFSLKDAMRNSITEIDCKNENKLGIVVPTYGWGIPWAVADYLRSVKLNNLPDSAYIFSIHTCGNMSGAGAVRMKQLLNEKSLELNASFSVVTTSSEYIFGKKTTPAERQQIMADADKSLDGIIEDIKDDKSVVRMRKTVPAFMETAIGKLTIPSQRKVKKFRVSDACIGCGKCSRVCPQGIIEILDGHPVWTDDCCLNCFACVTYCPKHAISK